MLPDQRCLVDPRVQGAAGAQSQTGTGAVVLSYMCLTYSPPSLGAGGSEQRPNMYVLSLRLCRTARV